MYVPSVQDRIPCIPIIEVSMNGKRDLLTPWANSRGGHFPTTKMVLKYAVGTGVNVFCLTQEGFGDERRKRKNKLQKVNRINQIKYKAKCIKANVTCANVDMGYLLTKVLTAGVFLYVLAPCISISASDSEKGD